MLARRADARYFWQGWLPHISTSSASMGVSCFVSFMRSRQIAIIPNKIIFVDSKISHSVLSLIFFFFSVNYHFLSVFAEFSY